MFDGVGWAAGEIVVFMIAALLVGGAIGWILGRWIQQGTMAEKFESQLVVERERAKRVEARLADSNDGLEKARLQLQGSEGRLGELQAELDSAESAAAAMDAQLTAVGIEQAAATESSSEKDTEIARLTGELGSCTADRERLSNDIATLELAVTEQSARIAALQADLELAAAAAPALEPEPAAQPARVAEPAPVAEVGRESVPGAVPSKEEGLARVAEIAARTAGEGAVADDDLKKVHGIGPKLERTLKGLGITSFRQIANFQSGDIAFVTAALGSFKGRIERDDWMASAAEEHRKKYGEPA